MSGKIILNIWFILVFYQALSQNTTSIDVVETQLQKLPSDEERIGFLSDFLKKSETLKDESFRLLVSKYQLFALENKDWDEALVFTNRLAAYYIYENIDHEAALNELKSFEKHLLKTKDVKERAKFYISYAEAATYKQEFENSLKILDRAIEFLEKQKDSSLYEFGYAYLKAAENNSRLNHVVKSAALFRKAGQLFKHQNDTLYYLWTQNGLSSLLSQNSLYEEATKERSIIFDLETKIKEKQIVAMAHLQASLDARRLENTKDELYHINKALVNDNPAADINEIVRILVLANAVITFSVNEQLDRANQLLDTLRLKMSNRSSSTFLNAYYVIAQSENSFARGNWANAEQLARSLIDNVENSRDLRFMLELEALLAKISEAQGNSIQALRHYKNYIRFKDSLNVNAAKKRFAYVQAQFQSEKKDLEIQQQNQAIELLQAENRIANQRFLLGGIIAIGLFVGIYFWRQRLFSIREGKLQKRFAQNLIRHLEDERKRIARELHDSIGHNLLLIKNSLLLNVQSAPALIDQSIQEVQSMSQSLHPFQFEKLGLITSIRYTVENFQKNSTIFYSADIQIKKLEIEKEKELFIYRMLQECLANVEKHSQAVACQIQVLETATQFIFTVKDSGKGFEVTQKTQALNSLGLKNLKERGQLIGADLKIESKIGKGTLVTIIIPKKTN